jgi:hypothetical protein
MSDPGIGISTLTLREQKVHVPVRIVVLPREHS